MIEPKPLQQVDRTYVRYQGRKFSYFAGCDYFRMASHPQVLAAVGEGLKKFGLNVAASRLTTGNHAIYAELEATLKKFFAAPAALVVSNGYATNLVVAQALKGEFSQVAIDERAHVSLKDASGYFDCPVIPFKHRDPKDLARVLAKKRGKTILLTDGMLSHNGEIAPLPDYLKILPANGLMLLDDAHGAGVLGKTGKGTLENAGVSRQRLVQTVTLSKAFGVYGGAILCSPALREKIIQVSGMFAGSTPLPLPLAYAAKKSIGIVQAHPEIRRRLNRNVERVKTALSGGRFSIPATPAPIIAYTPTNGQEVESLKKELIKRSVFPSFIRYPGGPKNGYFRFVLSSEHSEKQLDALIEALQSF